MTCWHDILASFPAVHDTIHLYDSLAFGNHEDDDCNGCGSGTHLDTEGEAEYLAHFNQPPTYFSFDHKRAHFVALDTQSVPYDVNSEQYAFISSDLTQTKQRVDDGMLDWVIVFMHHPMYTSCIDSCSHHGNMTGIRAVYQPLFDSYGVDLVLQGHVHAYERTKPMKYDASITHPDTFDYVNPQGQIYITVGTGGQSLYQYSTKPEMSVFQLEDLGFLQVDITRTSLVGRFIDNSDRVRDSFTIVKVAYATASEPDPTTITDTWATNVNTADFLNNYQLKLGMKITDPERRNMDIESVTFHLYKNDAVSAPGTLRAVLTNFDTNTLIATSTNTLDRSTLTQAYLPYEFKFAPGATTPANNNFFIGLECLNCNSDKIVMGENKNNPYAAGNPAVYRSGAWLERIADAVGSVSLTQ
jgi:hypothetical protein